MFIITKHISVVLNELYPNLYRKFHCDINLHIYRYSLKSIIYTYETIINDYAHSYSSFIIFIFKPPLIT